MVATISNVGINYLTKAALGQTTVGNYNVHLFVNNHTPAVGDTVSSYTECSLSGYAAIALTSSSWSGSSTSGEASYTYPAITFDFSSYTGTAVVIYGYYLTDSTNAVLIVAEAFSSSFSVPLSGGYVTVNLTWLEEQF